MLPEIKRLSRANRSFSWTCSAGDLGSRPLRMATPWQLIIAKIKKGCGFVLGFFSACFRIFSRFRVCRDRARSWHRMLVKLRFWNFLCNPLQGSSVLIARNTGKIVFLDVFGISYATLCRDRARSWQGMLVKLRFWNFLCNPLQGSSVLIARNTGKIVFLDVFGTSYATFCRDRARSCFCIESLHKWVWKIGSLQKAGGGWGEGPAPLESEMRKREI